MSFVWKPHNAIWKGEGIYHLTFVVVNRQPLLGVLVPIEQCTRKGVPRLTELTDVEYTPLGLRICHKIEELGQCHSELKICAKVIIPDHVHLVIWVHDALRKAERGVVTYTAAINEGEKAVAKAIRAAGYPLVVLLTDGFLEEGTEAARYYHPNGVYHHACGEGRLLLLAPHAENYANARLIDLTDAELMRKVEEKHQIYAPLPLDSTRWRFLAGNVMLRMVAE